MPFSAPRFFALSLFFLLALLSLIGRASESGPVFQFHLLAEPLIMDPQALTGSGGNYLLQNLYRGLYRYHSRDGLVPEGAKTCVRLPKTARRLERLKCTLRPEHKWSDGQAIRAQDYVAALRRLIDPKEASPQSFALFTLKNARTIWKGELEPVHLGVRAPDARTLIFEFAEDDPEFEYKLIHPALSPLPPSGFVERAQASQLIASGPYKIKEWKQGAWVRLEPNPHYPRRSSSPAPKAQAYFIDEDTTALRLFEARKLDFLRRLVASEIPRFRGRPEFHQFPMARFDYIGFGPDFKDHNLREALVRAVRYEDFLKVFDTGTRPGCPSFPSRLLDKPVCLEFKPQEARTFLKRAPPPPRIKFYYSRMGGDDIFRAAEFFQAQWKKHLGLNIELQSEEQTMYVRHLRTHPPPIFRKGVGMDRPTCLAALETFKKNNPENFIRFEEPEYERLLDEVARARSTGTRRRACRKAMQFLLESA
ncbi:MAG: peptide ABC transporter substrate-binding protein, partial [Bdellovibrionales bacterium]